LNQQTITVAHELKAAGEKITLLALDPGDIPTRLSRWQGTTTMEQSVRGMVEVIENASVDISGSYMKWNGKTIPY